MKKKIFTLLTLGIMISVSASSQTIKDNIDKAAKDKSNADRAAKADVLIHKKIIDTTQINIKPKNTVSKTPVITNNKCIKHKYKKKVKKRS